MTMYWIGVATGALIVFMLTRRPIDEREQREARIYREESRWWG